MSVKPENMGKTIDRKEGWTMNEEFNTYENESKSPKRKNGVGKVVAITLGMVLLTGVAAAGGYSVRTIMDQLQDGKQTEESASKEQIQNQPEIKETVSQTETVISQSKTGSVILTDVSDVVEAAMPSVVSITNTSVYTSTGFGFWNEFTTEIPQESSGSGIIIGQNDKELLLVTNNHVIENSESLTVQFADGSTAEANVKGAKPSSDIAIISVPLDSLTEETMKAIAIARLGDSDSLRMGQGVIAIGNALGYGQSVTEGCISALNRQVTTNDGNTLTLLQTSAAINPGNSGGALLNASGEVIGINTAKVMSDKVEGIGYAIPISSVMDLINDMMSWATREKVTEEDLGYLGIQPWTVDKESAANFGMPAGAYVYSVVEGSPADKGGMKEKDIITGIDQYSIRDAADLKNALRYYKGGDTVAVTVQRLHDGTYQEIDLEVTLAYKRDFTNPQ